MKTPKKLVRDMMSKHQAYPGSQYNFDYDDEDPCKKRVEKISKETRK